MRVIRRAAVAAVQPRFIARIIAAYPPPCERIALSPPNGMDSLLFRGGRLTAGVRRGALFIEF
jgi:hypothetical protein